MRIVSPLLKTVVYPALSRIGAFHFGSDAGLAVITYHGVIPPGYKSIDAAFDGNLISAATLRRQIQLLKKQYCLVSPEQVLAFLENGQKLPSRAVLLTCDDGLLNCVIDMLPVLQGEDAKCLFFVTGASAREMRTMLWYEELFLILLRARSGPFRASCDEFTLEDSLGTPEQRRAAWWRCVRLLSQVGPDVRATIFCKLRDELGCSLAKSNFENPVMCRRYGLMVSEELKQLVSAGMTIGAHTVTHPILPLLDKEAAYQEIAQARTMLTAVLGVEVWAFAYPFGDPQSVSEEVVGTAEQAGYKAAFLNYGGGLGCNLPRYALPRIHVTNQMRLAEFEAHVSGFYARLQNYRRTGSL